jgi:hypothetical protein
LTRVVRKESVRVLVRERARGWGSSRRGTRAKESENLSSGESRAERVRDIVRVTESEWKGRGRESGHVVRQRERIKTDARERQMIERQRRALNERQRRALMREREIEDFLWHTNMALGVVRP